MRKVQSQPLCGKTILLLLISATLLQLVNGWQDEHYKIVFYGKPERTLCFESHQDIVIAKACLTGEQREEHPERYCHIFDTVHITQVGHDEHFGFGVYIPPYDGKICANQTTAKPTINHVILSRKNQLVVSSLTDYTFKQNNCNGQVAFQFLDPASKNTSSKDSISDLSLPKNERLFYIVSKTHSSSEIRRILVVSKAGKTSWKRLGREDLTHVKLRKHSMFYLMKVMG